MEDFGRLFREAPAGHIAAPILVLAIALTIYFSRSAIRQKQEKYHAQQIAAGLNPAPLQRRWPWARGLLSVVGSSALYLLAFRAISLLPAYYRDQKGGAVLMSFSFIFFGPFIAGVLTVAQGTRKEPWPVSVWIMAPWISVLAVMLLSVAVAWEGLICLIFIVPPAMIAASLGGVLAGSLQRYFHNRQARTVLYCVAVLPLVLAMVEGRLKQPLEIRTVNTSTVIHAPASVVWTNIERVRAIQPKELRSSWANTIGFPRPVEATLSHEGVGGVRNATFERGLSFTETITEWVPNERIVFTIRADTSAIPSTTLDEHVTVGGRFFDVLEGEYDLRPLPDGDTLLHLSSQERLSTDFNAYAAMWSDGVMHDMQSNILHVIRNRCEAKADSH